MGDKSFIISQGSTAEGEKKRLSNSDFRQFLVSGGRRVVEEDEDDDEVHEQQRRRAKKHANYQRWVKKKAAIEEQQNKIKYRDRAKERRKGLNPDYESVQEEYDNSEIKLDASKNKYLGGDVKHTHLVRGLDYQLLQRNRDEADSDDEQDDQKLERQMRQQEIRHKTIQSYKSR